MLLEIAQSFGFFSSVRGDGGRCSFEVQVAAWHRGLALGGVLCLSKNHCQCLVQTADDDDDD